MTTDELRKAEARYQRAFARSEELREERNALVREALKDGWTHARIAEATGLTRGRIGQLATPNESELVALAKLGDELLAEFPSGPSKESR